MRLTRRQFLGLTGGAALTGTAAWAGMLHKESSSSGPASSSQGAARVLVVVQLGGGNDALNTVVPHDGRYHDLRPQLAIADDKLVALSGETSVGLHPALQPLVPLWDAHQLALIPGVGFATDSRSHFASLDTWWTASPDHKLQTGWLGRWLDATGAAAVNPLAAISLGSDAVNALASEHSQVTAVNDLNAFELTSPSGLDGARLVEALTATASPAQAEPLLAQAQRSVTSALRAVDVLSRAGVNAAAPAATEDEDDVGDTTGPLTAGLDAAANLIDLELATRVLLVSGNGFDTHADQLDQHERLLDDLAKGVSGFFSTLEQKGHADRVVVMTTSEFGRRAAENGSNGTDHGLGGVQFLIGPAVRGGLHGNVDIGHLTDGDLPVQTDARSMYAAALDWLGGPSSELLDGYRDDLHLVST